MEYDGYVVGPKLRRLRVERKLTLDEVSERTGLSISSLKQLEQGGRRLSMKSLYLLMTAYECDANEVLNMDGKCVGDKLIEEVMTALPEKKRKEYAGLFLQIIKILEKI